MDKQACLWGNCKNENKSLGYFCREHYFLKEARYALYDLTATDEEWYSHVKDKRPENRQHFKDWGIKRLIQLAEFYLYSREEQ